MKKYLVKLPKAANGLQKVRAAQNGQRGIISGVAGAGAEALAPGVGGAVIGGLESLSSTLKDENGLYKNKFGQALDGLNPVTAVSRLTTGVGQLFSGEKFDLDGQDAIKKAMAEEKLQKEKEENWSRVGADTSGQLSQFKKGARKVAAKAIEIEGGEPHFSKKVNGARDLKFFAPDGPTHREGGIAVLAENGDAVVTAKKDLGKKAVAAHQRGDHRAVEKIIGQMPEDKGRKATAADGIRSAKGRQGKRTYAPTTAQAEPTVTYALPKLPGLGDFGLDNGPGLESRRNALADLPKPGGAVSLGTPATGAAGAKKSGGGVAGALMSGLQAAPTIYNLGQGLFGDVAKTERRSYNPELQQYQDLSAPQRTASRQAMNQQVSNARNLSGGSVGNLRSNRAQAFAENATRQGSIDAQESGRKLGVNNQNVELRNQAALINKQTEDQADQLDLQNQAKKSEALSKGLEGIAGLAGNALLTKNTVAKEGADRAMLSEVYKNYTMDPLTGKPVLRKLRQGMKSLKLKNC
jgi:hypothetical protein